MARTIPSNALVMLVGAAASGKSTWARSCFRDTEVVSSDRCRALVADDEEDQSASPQAFAVFYEILGARASLGRLGVADSTALHPVARARLREVAARFGVPHLAVVIAPPVATLLERNRQRERRVPDAVVLRQAEWVDELLREGMLEREGYDAVLRLEGNEGVRVVPAEEWAAGRPERRAPRGD